MLDVKEANWLLGIMISGDVGPLTFYTSKRQRHVVFDKRPPLNPASPLQLSNRNRFRLIARAWNGLDQESRDRWELASRRGGCRCIGYHLFVWWEWKRDLPALRTLERNSGVLLVN